MSGTLPHWLERWLGVESSTAGEGTLWRLDNAWPLSALATLLFIVAVFLLVMAIYRVEAGAAGRWLRAALIGLRLTAIGLVALMIGQWVLKLNPTQLPYLVVMVDDSESMRINDHYADEKLRADIARRIEKLGLDGQTRLNAAKTLLLENDAALLGALDKRYKLKVYFCSELARPQTSDLDQLKGAIRALEPTGKATRLGDCVRAVLNDQGLTGIAAIVLMSDGVTTDGQRLVGETPLPTATNPTPSATSTIRDYRFPTPDPRLPIPDAATGAADFARSRGVPMFVVGLGSDAPLKDVELSDLRVADVAFVDDLLAFKVNLSARGFVGREVEVRLKDKQSSAVLARQSAKIDADGKPQPLTITYRPDKVGQYDFVVETDQLPDEVRYDNNQIQRQVSVRKAQIRVLLVWGYPAYEFRYLKTLLERDTTIDLHTVLQDADVEYASQEKTALAGFPLRRDDLLAYDVVLFGDVNPSLLSAEALKNLAEFVTQKGGGLALVAGSRFNPLAYRNTPLAALMPIDLATVAEPDAKKPITDGFVMTPTPEGLGYPNMQLGDSAAETLTIWQKLPPLYWMIEAQKKETAETLADNPKRFLADGRKAPVIVQRRSGAGMVLFHATDETYRWRFQVGDVFFARYWVQTIRYLSRTKLLGNDSPARLTADRQQYQRGEPVRLRLEFFDERSQPSGQQDPVVMLRRGDQPQRHVTLKRTGAGHELFEASLDDLPQGAYHASLVQPAMTTPPSVNFTVRVADAEFERTQMDLGELEGAALRTKGRFYRFETAGALLGDLPTGRQIPLKATQAPVELWNKWPVLALLLVCLVAEWTLRKRAGML